MKEIEIFEDIADIEEKLNTDISSGLSRRRARERAAEEERADTSFFVRKKRNFLSCFFGVVKMLPAAILIFIAIAAFFMGRTQLSVAVLSTFISGSITSGMLYLSAQRQSERMEAYSNPTARVLRDGREYVVDSRNLVSGDVLILRRGDYIPADVCVVESKELVISAIRLDGEVKYIDEVIPDGFDGRGRLLAGSFVASGYAKAVVTATGNDTVMSESVRAGGLLKKNSDPAVIRRTYKYLSGFVFIISVAALILAIVGMFTAKYVGILEVFLMYLALILSMTLISSPIAGRILLAAMLKRAAKNGQGGDYAIIKNNNAIDALPAVTDVIVCGISGITDGEKYLSSMQLCGETVENIGAADPADFIFECIYSYVKAKNERGDIEGNERRMLDGLAHGMQRIKFDRDAEDVKIKSLYFGASIDGGEAACVEMADRSFRVYVGDDFSLADRCPYYRVRDGICEADEQIRAFFEDYKNCAGSRGETVYVVISEIDGALILEGLVGLREGICESFCETAEVLSRKGITVSAALPRDNEYNRFYLRAAGFSDERISLAENTLEAFDFGKAYIGYSAEELARAISNAKAHGHTVAAIGISDEYREIYSASDVFVSYDNLNYGSSKFRESELEIPVADGYEFSQRCSQRARTEAEVIIGRGSGESGGLRGFFEAVKCAESFTHNYLQMTLLFISIVSALILMTFSSFVSGILFISYPVILLLAVALVFFTVAAFSTFKPRSFIEKKPNDLGELARASVPQLVSPLFAAAVYFALAVYLDASGYIMDIAAIPLATTLGVIVTYAFSFFGSMRTCIGKKIALSDIKGFAEKDKSKNKLLNMAAMTLVLSSVIRMVLTALIIPSFADEYGYTGACEETFALLGVYIAVFIACELIIKLLRLIGRKKHK